METAKKNLSGMVQCWRIWAALVVRPPEKNVIGVPDQKNQERSWNWYETFKPKQKFDTPKGSEEKNQWWNPAKIPEVERGEFWPKMEKKHIRRVKCASEECQVISERNKWLC